MEGIVIAGKDEYLLPEQARREVTDARADLFLHNTSLGNAGRREYLRDQSRKDNSQEHTRTKYSQISQNLLRNRSTPRRILQHGFKRDRDKRYQSAQAMLTALETFLYDDGYGLRMRNLPPTCQISTERMAKLQPKVA